MSEPLFVPGELVRVAKTYHAPEMVGLIATVQRARFGRWREDGSCGWGYKTELNETTDYWHVESHLAKLPPSTPTQFDAAIWQPKKVTA